MNGDGRSAMVHYSEVAYRRPQMVFICINGILSNPGDAEGWTDRAVTWLHIHTTEKAEKFEYSCAALTRRLRQGWRAQAIARMVGYYVGAGYEVVLVAHSNGGDLVERVLKLVWPVKIRSAHLIAPACNGDVLAHALSADSATLAAPGPQLGRLHLYGSGKDRALLVASWSKKLFGWLGMGYGDLGRRVDSFADTSGPTGATGSIQVKRDDSMGHSDWFERGENFERTMRAIIESELIQQPTA